MFSERLDFLMRLTATSNSALARAISFDPSYISKLRSGKRKLPRNHDFFDRAVPYFVRNLTTAFQKKAVSDVLLSGRPLPDERAALERAIDAWLRGDGDGAESPVGRFLQDASGLTRDNLAAAAERTAADNSAADHSAADHSAPAPGAGGADAGRETALCYYGNEGKRRAVERFLSALCAEEQPQTLLLYSDEEMSWLYEDPGFTRRWAGLLSALLARGGRITMIHTVSRSVTELLEAVKGWMPLYLSGRIEPYYCPRLRDGVTRRSLFVARGHSALVSSSVMTRTEGMVNLLFSGGETVAAFEEEFRGYFALCRPLMRLYRGAQDATALLRDLRAVQSGGGALYLAQSLPSFSTVPRSVLAAMAGEQAEAAEKLRAKAAAALRARLDRGDEVVELLNLPDPKDPGTPSLPLWPMLGMPELRYDAALLGRHLAAVQRWTEQYENYHVLLTDQISPELMVLTSENDGALLLCPLPVVFRMEEQNISLALLEYLRRIAAQERRGARASLSDYLRALRDDAP